MSRLVAQTNVVAVRGDRRLELPDLVGFIRGPRANVYSHPERVDFAR